MQQIRHGAMNLAGRVRCNIMPIAKGYGRASQPFFDCASHALGILSGCFEVLLSVRLKPRRARGFLLLVVSSGLRANPIASRALVRQAVMTRPSWASWQALTHQWVAPRRSRAPRPVDLTGAGRATFKYKQDETTTDRSSLAGADRAFP